MNEVSLNGNDILIVNNRLLTSFFDKDYGVLTFPNKMATVKAGKDQNSVIAISYPGFVGELALRMLVGSYDDAFLNSIQRAFMIDAPSFPLMTGQLIKRSGDGLGAVISTVYALQAGVPTDMVPARSNAEGDEEQGCSEWKFTFALVTRQVL